MKNGTHFDPAHWPLAIASRAAGDETHLVMGDNVSRHRVCLRGLPAGHPIASLIPCDALLDARLQALAALDRWLCGARRGAQMFGPTAYQARRLHLLLAILDLRRGGGVTSHMVAKRLVYPRLSIGQGASWKSSPERRRTQRLIHEAEALAAGGYRTLLAGRAGRQK